MKTPTSSSPSFGIVFADAFVYFTQLVAAISLAELAKKKFGLGDLGEIGIAILILFFSQAMLKTYRNNKPVF